MYRSMGFKRVVLGREVTLKEIREIKDAVPDVELEAFAHGAMCIAYAGRCLMSAYLTARSAQAGACSHTCRWDFDVLADPLKAKQIAETGALVLEEKKRPGEYFRFMRVMILQRFFPAEICAWLNILMIW